MLELISPKPLKGCGLSGRNSILLQILGFIPYLLHPIIIRAPPPKIGEIGKAQCCQITLVLVAKRLETWQISPVWSLRVSSSTTLLLGVFFGGSLYGFWYTKVQRHEKANGIQANIIGFFPYKTAKVPRLAHED